MGGILAHTGIPGFLENIEELYERADTETTEWRNLADIWWETYAKRPVNASAIRAMCVDHELLGEMLGGGSERSQLSRIGRALRRNVDRVFGHYKLVRDDRTKKSSGRYALRLVKGKDSGSVHRS